MKKILFAVLLACSTLFAKAQQQLLSYEDFRYIITSNLQKADDFMQSKGYVPVNKKLRPGNKKYNLKFPDGNTSEVELRSDGKRLFIYIATDELEQYNLINNSIAAYILSKENNNDVLSYKVKDLGNIYVIINEKVPYSPIRKDYDIRIVSDKEITAYN